MLDLDEPGVQVINGRHYGVLPKDWAPYLGGCNAIALGRINMNWGRGESFYEPPTQQEIDNWNRFKLLKENHYCGA